MKRLLNARGQRKKEKNRTRAKGSSNKMKPADVMLEREGANEARRPHEEI